VAQKYSITLILIGNRVIATEARVSDQMPDVRLQSWHFQTRQRLGAGARRAPVRLRECAIRPHPDPSTSCMNRNRAEPEYPPDLNAHLWRSCRNPSGQLRCGILLDGCGGIEKWAGRVLELLSREPAIVIESIYLVGAPDPSSRSSDGALFGWLTRWSSLTDSPLGRVEIRAPDGVPIVALGDRQVAAGLDVLIWLESRALDLDCDGLARLGVLYLCCGDPDEPRSDPPYWSEVASGRAVSTLALEQNTGHGNVRRLALCHLATQQGLHVTKNAVQPLTLAGPVLIRSLLNILDRENPLDSSPARPANQRRLSRPGNLETASLVARQAFRTAATRLHSLRREAGWFVAVRSNPDLFRTRQDRFIPQAFRDVPSPGGSQLADPIVVGHDGRNWLFVEEIPAGTLKGHLSVLEIGANGDVGKPVPILEKSYHLSYPFVFRDGSEFFMLPETSANNTIELYRAVRFPFEWKLEKVLFSNVRAVDTTPLFLDGIWYLLTTSARHGHETFLFWSNSLDGEWHYHPRNPICSDIRRARGAGPLFRSHGALIRPAQNCSVRYGYAIALNRVLRISPTDYEEELIETIYPTWRKGLLGTHTLSSNDTFEAIDGLRWGA